MSNGYVRVDIRPEVHDLLEQCRHEYLRHHPELLGVPLSRSKIVRQVCLYYLGERHDAKLPGEISR